ncbi:MAG: hypothetical protein HN350_20595 [Phycisphaerales bacterium]|jgi:hypothetical protein|nr:hypothetical protein [Phycisphaerales bacterium]
MSKSKIKMHTWGKQLVAKVICPNCWHSFPPEECLYISKHPDLVGDPVAGANEYQRFEAMRFNVQGEALDAMGFATTDVACPRCHLQVPESMLEVAPLFVSIIGAPASGKSYFLTSMTWELRRLIPKMALSFSDADPMRNSPIHEYEQSLFMNPQPNQPTEIRKTQSDDPRLYRTTMIEGAAIRFPVPLQFLLWPTPEHSKYAAARQVGRLVVMYDNAGEDFLPGAEDGSSPVVQHLAKSQILFSFFDPTQDPGFRAECGSVDPQLSGELRPGQEAPAIMHRQETLLRETSVRIRRYLGMAQDERLKKPLIVIIPKFDIIAKMAGISLDTEPYTESKEGRPALMDIGHVEQVSNKLRELFQRLCPEYVASAESLSMAVRYVPVSALGGSPELVHRDEQSFYGVRPADIKPKWVTVPLMYSLCKWAPGTITRATMKVPTAQPINPDPNTKN